MHLAPDTILQGRYRVVRLLAQGGMGAVYEATDTRLGNTVALKQTLVHDPQLRAAFEREARLLAGLHHPALPVVSDHFTEGADQFLVMQFIPGDDLARLLERNGGPFPMPQVLAWADRLLDALDYLHTREPPVIHRDIKPLNLKLTPRGEVILLDFGLAKGATSAASAAGGPSIFGYTPQYAPIEQIQGTGTGPRSDIYALAATLYQLLTGRTPPDALTRAAAVLGGQPDPLPHAHSANPAVSRAVSEVLRQALAIAPEQRTPTAAALRDALRDAVEAAEDVAPVNSSGTATIVMGSRTVAGAGATAVASPQPFGGYPLDAAPTAIDRPRVSDAPTPPWRRAAVFAALLLAAVLIAAGMLIFSLGDDERAAEGSGGAVTTGQTGGEQVGGGAPQAQTGATRAEPAALGESLRLDGWDVTVLRTVRGDEAWQLAYAENSSNDPAPDGYEYILVRVRFTTTFRQSDEGQLFPSITGSSRVERNPVALVVPEKRVTDTTPGGTTVEGWVPYLIPTDERDLLLNIEPLGLPDGVADFSAFVALDPGARQIDDPALAAIRPNAVGKDFSEPAPRGETSISEDWEVTLTDVVRGEDAFAQLLAENQFNDPPPEGFEYLLLTIKVRYIGLTPSYGAVMANGLDFATHRPGQPLDSETVFRAPAVIEPDELSAYLYPGGEAAGRVALLAPVGEPVVVIYRPNTSLDHINTRFLALE